MEIFVGPHLQQTSGLSSPTLGPTPSGVPSQEILLADSADHSAAQQTDTTLCSNQEGTEWEETVMCHSSWREESGWGDWKLTPECNPSSSLSCPEPISGLFFIPLLLMFQLLSVSRWPCWICHPVRQVLGRMAWESVQEKTMSLWSKECWKTRHSIWRKEKHICSWLGRVTGLLCDETAVSLHLWASVSKELSTFVSMYMFVGVITSPASTSQKHSMNK